MNFKHALTIAVDFDGTIVEDAYPEIGKPQVFAFETLKRLQEQGHRLILWTYRCGDRLDEAVSFCEEKGLVFYAVNKSFPEEEDDINRSRKILADLFIDDRNLGGFPGWAKVYQTLTNETPQIPKKKKGFFSFFKSS